MSRTRFVAILLLTITCVFLVGFFSRDAVLSLLSGAASRRFHAAYYDSEGTTWKNTYWLGTPVQKLPLDLWIYQELIVLTRPDVIIESGTGKGGSALFFASICDLINHGRVISIDIHDYSPPPHERIRYLIGSSLSPNIVEKIESEISPADKVMAVLDSDHAMSHVLAELRTYSKLVTKGAYLVVEDTNINGHPVASGHGPGPMEAVAAFLAENQDFVVDSNAEKFLVSFNPRGWLRRLR